jgi:O-antigen ligase
MVFFIAWAVLSAPFGIYVGRSVRFLLEQFLREALVILTIACAVRNLTDLRRLLATYAAGAIFFAVMAQGTGARQIGGGGYDANDSSMFIVSGMPLILYFLVREKRPAWKLLFGFGLVACGSAVVISGSRGGFLALVAVLAFSLVFLKGIKPFWRAAVVAAAVGVVMFQADAEFWERMQSISSEDDYNRVSYTGRQQVWTRGIGYMVDQPIFGVGIDNFRVAEGRHPDAVAMLEQGRGVKFSVAHSIWISTGAELGLPGIGLLIALFVVSFRVLWSVDGLARRTGGRPLPAEDQLVELARPLLGVLIGVVVAGTFLSRAYSSLVWMPLGMALILIKVGRLQARTPTRAPRSRPFATRRMLTARRTARPGELPNPEPAVRFSGA